MVRVPFGAEVLSITRQSCDNRFTDVIPACDTVIGMFPRIIRWRRWWWLLSTALYDAMYANGWWRTNSVEEVWVVEAVMHCHQWEEAAVMQLHRHLHQCQYMEAVEEHILLANRTIFCTSSDFHFLYIYVDRKINCFN
ncbi:unnamed protein product [Haemonchus placei]|uniref:Uncharacterized protein n=1 Tax=Haemonchus placei TaxID=6290 RepID=A0A3P7UCJ9_HAEPC|nr:unnamed protein product [Haemonchus placei]